MLSLAAIASVLVVVTVIVHALGFSALLRVIMRSNAATRSGLAAATALVIGLACGPMLIHLIEIGVWGCFYVWWGFLPDAESALYFSGATYTTVGYGDLVPPKPWRMLAPIEAMTGVLMWGLSTGLFFAMVSRHINRWVSQSVAPARTGHAASREALTRPERDS